MCGAQRAANSRSSICSWCWHSQERFSYRSFSSKPRRMPSTSQAACTWARRTGEGGEIALVLEGEFDGGDLGGIAVGEVGDVAFFDFAVLAEGFAEVDGLVGFAVGGGPASADYVHFHTIKHYSPIINRQSRLIIKILHVYIFRTKIDLTP